MSNDLGPYTQSLEQMLGDRGAYDGETDAYAVLYGIALDLLTECSALRATEDNLRQKLKECQDQRRAAFRRIEEQDANEKVLLAQVQGHTQWREMIIKANEQTYGKSAVRYKFSLTKSGKCMNTFPKAIDGRWFALVPAEDDGHISYVAYIAELERKLEKVRNDAERYRWLRSGSNWPAVFESHDAPEPLRGDALDAAMKGKE